MNCVEFRRELGIDPQSNEIEFARHRAECPRCADAAERAVTFDRDLVHALGIDVPAQLADSILFAQATAERRRRTTYRRGVILAAVASLALAVGIVGMRVEAKPLSTQAVEHLRSEQEVLTMTKPVPAAAVLETFAARGVTLKRVPDGISFVAPCPVGKHRSVHLLMPASAPSSSPDPVTVIYVADQRISQREDFTRDGWSGRSLPLRQGTLILLGSKTAEFDRVEALWRDAIDG